MYLFLQGQLWRAFIPPLSGPLFVVAANHYISASRYDSYKDSSRHVIPPLCSSINYIATLACAVSTVYWHPEYLVTGAGSRPRSVNYKGNSHVQSIINATGTIIYKHITHTCHRLDEYNYTGYKNLYSVYDVQV